MPHFVPHPRTDGLDNGYAPSNSFKSLVSANTCTEIMMTNVAVRTSCSVHHCVCSRLEIRQNITVV